MRHVAAGLALLFAGAALGVEAERPMRDPTVAPISLQVPPPGGAALGAAAPPSPPAAASSASPSASAAQAQPRYILVVDGRRYVIDAGRRRSVGDSLGSARIERIDDAAIWVRDGATLQRLPMFGPALRRAAAPAEPRALSNTPATAQAPAAGSGRPVAPTLQPGEPS